MEEWRVSERNAETHVLDIVFSLLSGRAVELWSCGEIRSEYLPSTNKHGHRDRRQSEEMNENLICKEPPCWILFDKYLHNCEAVKHQYKYIKPTRPTLPGTSLCSDLLDLTTG